MKSRLLISLLSAGLAVTPCSAQSKQSDHTKYTRDQKWVWAFSLVTAGKPVSESDRAKAYKILEDEEALLDKNNSIQAAVNYFMVVDFYRRIGDLVRAKAKEGKAAGKIEAAALTPGISDLQLVRLADCLEGIAAFHLKKGLAENKEEFERAEVFLNLGLKLRDRLPAKDQRRSMAYRSMIKFCLDNNKPTKANDYTLKLSKLLHGETETSGSSETALEELNLPGKRPCSGCGKG